MASVHIVEGFENSFGGDHARLHCGMCAFDFRYIQKSGGTANKATAREGQFRHRLKAAFIKRTRAIGDTAATFEYITHGRMRLETLKFFKW